MEQASFFGPLISLEGSNINQKLCLPVVNISTTCQNFQTDLSGMESPLTAFRGEIHRDLQRIRYILFVAVSTFSACSGGPFISEANMPGIFL